MTRAFLLTAQLVPVAAFVVVACLFFTLGG